MTIADINEIEQKRDKEQFGVIHLLVENGFYRAHDWSAWLMTTFPFGEALNKPLRISAKRLKDGYIEAWVGFPVSSLGKYVPNDGSVTFNPVNDTQIDVSIELSDDLKDATYEDIRQYVDSWKESLPMNDGKVRKRESHEIAEAAPRITRISDIIGRVLSFPLESKSPMEAYEFLRSLRQQIAAMF